jgi:hypothetical protein
MKYCTQKHLFLHLNIYALNYTISQEIQLYSDLKFD